MAIKSLFHYTLIAFLVISTYFFLPTPQAQMANAVDYAYQIQELFIRYGIILLFAISLLLKPERKFQAKELGFFLLYIICIGTFMNFDMQMRRSILNIFFGIFFIKLIVEYFDFRYLKAVIWGLFGIVLINVLFCYLQKLNIDPLFRPISNTVQGFPHPVGLMRLEAHLGVISAIIAPMLVIISPWLVLFVLPLLWYSTSSAAIGAFIISMGFILYRRSKLLFIPAIFLLITAGVFYVLKYDMPGGNFDYRFGVWFHAISETLRHSMFYGFGIGSFAKWAPTTDQATNPDKLVWIWAHNEYVQLFFETGIVGLITCVVWLRKETIEFFSVVKNKQHDCLFASFLALGLVSIFHFPFHIGRLAGISLFSISLYKAKHEALKCD